MIQSFRRLVYLCSALLIVISCGSAKADNHEERSPHHSNLLLASPIDCSQNSDCWIVNYVDVNPSNINEDFHCNVKTYDGHKGTDFAVPSYQAFEEGVNILAVADGTVLRIRNGETDSLKNEEELDVIRQQQKECGNAILLQHRDGYQTIYCHLKKDSLKVLPDQQVKAGEVIAQLGLSGITEFPHVHLGVMKDGIVLDPFTGQSNQAGCGQDPISMWHPDSHITYHQAAIFDARFEMNPPDFDAIERGAKSPEIIPLDSPALLVWAGFYNVEKGDVISISIESPEGEEIASMTRHSKKDRALQYYYTGKKTGNSLILKRGNYKATIQLSRKEKGKLPALELRKTVDINVR